MALRFLLDTSALLAYNRQEQGWARVQELFEKDDSEILAASVSLTEFTRRRHRDQHMTPIPVDVVTQIDLATEPHPR
ncbi:MAG TPA: hypothetical protein VFC23_06365 [Thermoanaerobaculia bacterium]|nr:hypothetical protein [Thermoanaerobaculia bacterium]